jgi:NAD(P)H-flavin reductase
VFNSRLYIPRPAIIEDTTDLTYDTRLYRLRFQSEGDAEHNYMPGQFVQVSILGAGEAPISICSSPTKHGCFELCVRKAGRVTGALASLKKGDEVGIRGPYGNFFPVEQLRGRPLLFVAGGIGLAPLRSVIRYVLDKRDDYGDVIILYGARTKEDIVFADELRSWGEQPGVRVFTTIDRAQQGWSGHVGVVTTLFDKIRGLSDYKALVCGPPIMIHFAIKELADAGWAAVDIITTLERHMKCGVGKCGHCYIAGKYVCTDGPVFTYEQIDALKVPV